jgi:hypothetical protein
MVKENVMCICYTHTHTHTHTGLLLRLETKKEILSFATTWMNLEDISQEQKTNVA